MEIKATGKLDLAAIKALIRVQLFRKADPKKRMIFWAVVYVAVQAVLILECILWGFHEAAGMYLFVTVVVGLLLCFMYFGLPKIQYKAMAQMKDAVNEYVFGEETLHITSVGNGFASTTELPYSILVKVWENSRYLFVFHMNNQTFVVDKSTIQGGTIEEIRSKLQAVVGKKYMRCRY